MTNEQRKDLVDKGMGHFVEIIYINESGYAGCNQKGTIVDRRLEPKAGPIQKNSMFGIPAPKEVGSEPWFLDSKGKPLGVGDWCTYYSSEPTIIEKIWLDTEDESYAIVTLRDIPQKLAVHTKTPCESITQSLIYASIYR